MQTKKNCCSIKEIDGEMLKAAYDKAAELITIAKMNLRKSFVIRQYS